MESFMHCGDSLSFRLHQSAKKQGWANWICTRVSGNFACLGWGNTGAIGRKTDVSFFNVKISFLRFSTEDVGTNSPVPICEMLKVSDAARIRDGLQSARACY